MSVAIVAIPEEDQYVWKISSEKVPHMTLLFLGEINDAGTLAQISQFVEHAVNTSVRRFGMSVDRRGELGSEDADVLFFDDYNVETLEQFRENLLKFDPIKTAHDAAPQFESWIPHLTLGFPDAPAKEDNRDYPGIHWVEFDRIALWMDDFEGPEFVIPRERNIVMSGQSLAQRVLSHYGVKGMRWGTRKARGSSAAPSAKPKKARTKFVKAPNKLSNAELAKRIKRMETEKKYNDLNKPDMSRGRKMVLDILANSGQRVATTALTGASLVAIRALVANKFGDDVAQAVTRRGK